MAFDVAAYKRAWAAANPDKIRAYKAARAPLTPEQKQRKLERARLRPKRVTPPSTPESRANAAERARLRRLAAPDVARARDKLKYAQTKEARRADQKRWRDKRDAAALEKKRERNAAWVEKNQEKMNAYKGAWKRQNPDWVAADATRRRAIKLNAMPKWLTDEDHAQIAAIYRLAAETGMQVDHIYPLRGKTVCGLHAPTNLQLLTPLENRRKGNKLPGSHVIAPHLTLDAQ